ncbi:MAG: protein kinase [Planctomycetes bacterium]|nr:protein kinase [Planctomycetota bacterium]
MGVVYAARTAEGRQVAIKVLVDLNEAQALLRFQREAEAHACVDAHPNVARIHAAGEHEGRPYLVMDLLSGGDLEERLKTTGRLSPSEVRTTPSSWETAPGSRGDRRTSPSDSSPRARGPLARFPPSSGPGSAFASRRSDFSSSARRDSPSGEPLGRATDCESGTGR